MLLFLSVFPKISEVREHAGQKVLPKDTALVNGVVFRRDILIILFGGLKI